MEAHEGGTLYFGAYAVIITVQTSTVPQSTRNAMNVVEQNVAVAMAMAAFAGISWYIGAEITVSLFLLFRHRRGLYFWSCALGIWGVILQTLFIILADFGVWTDLKASITMIYLSWAIMVVPQSWVLYSRLHLITPQRAILNWVRAALIFNSVVFGITTIPLGVLTVCTIPGVVSLTEITLADQAPAANCQTVPFSSQQRLGPPADDRFLPPGDHTQRLVYLANTSILARPSPLVLRSTPIGKD